MSIPVSTGELEIISKYERGVTVSSVSSVVEMVVAYVELFLSSISETSERALSTTQTSSGVEMVV